MVHLCCTCLNHPITRRIIAQLRIKFDLIYHLSLCFFQFGTVRSLTSVVRPAFVKPFAPFRLDVFAFDVPGARIDCQSPEHAPSRMLFTRTYTQIFIN